jgi:hypothetical protein
MGRAVGRWPATTAALALAGLGLAGCPAGDGSVREGGAGKESSAAKTTKSGGAKTSKSDEGPTHVEPGSDPFGGTPAQDPEQDGQD